MFLQAGLCVFRKQSMPKPRILERIGRHIAAPMALPRLVWKNLVHPFSQKAAETRYDATLGIDTGGYLAIRDLSLRTSH